MYSENSISSTDANKSTITHLYTHDESITLDDIGDKPLPLHAGGCGGCGGCGCGADPGFGGCVGGCGDGGCSGGGGTGGTGSGCGCR